MSRHVVVPIVILCVLSQLVVKCPAQWVDTTGNFRMAGFDGMEHPMGISPLPMNLGTNGFGYGVAPGPVYGRSLAVGGFPGQQINQVGGVPRHCIGAMGPGVSGISAIGYGNGANLGPGYLGPVGQSYGYGNAMESTCISNCLMGAGVDYSNGLGAAPAYSAGMSLPGAFMASPNPGTLNVMPGVIGAMDPSMGVLGNGLSVNPTLPAIPQQATLNANENTNTNNNVNINNNMGKHRHSRLGMLGIPHI